MPGPIDKELLVRARLRAAGGGLVAFSGGVDSTYLLLLAHAELGDRVAAVTAVSASLASSSLDETRAFCRDRGITHREVATDEFARPDYVANDGRRCYHCKSALMEAMQALLPEDPEACTTDRLWLGVIADDLGDWRPGLQAAKERGGSFPLAEAGMSKSDVRERSRALGLATWNRPAEPCLSSRVPYGEPVEVDGLRMIEQAEAALHHLGFEECRARHHRVGGVSSGRPRGWLCRIEVPLGDLGRVLEHRAAIDAALRHIGYAHVALDLAGFSSGGQNRLLTAAERG